MTRVEPGLCSVTFRALPPDEVLGLAARAGLRVIEWGADVHAPPGAPEAARALARRCSEAGLACPSYGTYYFAGRSPEADLEPILDTAEALGAAAIRVWAPLGTRPGAPEPERRRVAEALRACAGKAAARAVRVALEFHPGTLTETAAGTLDLLAEIDADVLSYWQPRPGDDAATALPELEAILEHLAHLHVFSWDPTPADRRPLAHLEALWRRALRAAAKAPSPLPSRCAHLEFVRDDSPEAFAEDAATLLRWIEEEAP